MHGCGVHQADEDVREPGVTVPFFGYCRAGFLFGGTGKGVRCADAGSIDISVYTVADVRRTQ